MRTVASVVADAMEHGSLFPAGYGRTVTLASKRRLTIRVQSDIFRLHWNRADRDVYYPDLLADITAALDARKAASC